MSKTKFKLNYAGVGELLKSADMMAICEEYANAIQARCGDGYEVSTYVGKSRVNASVAATSFEARKDNLDNNTLLKAVRG